MVRALLLPLTVKQFKSMQSLQRVAPQLKELQQKYKDDKQRLQQETMKFYQENKVNPFGSCLPLVAQLPVFLALFYMLREDLRLDICGQVAKPCGEVPPGELGPGVLLRPGHHGRGPRQHAGDPARRSTSARSCCRAC